MYKNLKNKKTVILSCMTVIIIILGILIYHGNVTIGITEIFISDDNIPEAFNGFKIAQISDLHNAQFGKNQKDLISKLETINPDIIVITGDLVDSRHTNVNISMDFIKQAVKLSSVYYVTGNHESRINENYQSLKMQMLEENVHILEDKSETLSLNGESIQIVGLNDSAFWSKGESKNIVRATVVQKLEKLIKDNTYTILLSHRPELFEIYCNANANLVFTGHAHGGQFRIPFIGGILAPDQGLFPKYSEGFFKNNNTTMIVSRGLGNSLFPFRVNNPPEIIAVTLKSSN